MTPAEETGGGAVPLGRGVGGEGEAFVGATGQPTARQETVVATIPRSPAYAGKAATYKVNVPDYEVDLTGHNAISGSFRFAA